MLRYNSTVIQVLMQLVIYLFFYYSYIYLGYIFINNLYEYSNYRKTFHCRVGYFLDLLKDGSSRP